MQRRRAQAETIHHAGCKVFHHHIGTRRHFAEQRFALLGLEIQRHRLLVGIQHRKRQISAAHVATAAQVFAFEGLDLDDARAGHRHHERGVRTGVDVRQVQHGDAG